MRASGAPAKAAARCSGRRAPTALVVAKLGELLLLCSRESPFIGEGDLWFAEVDLLKTDGAPLA
jgi:hypothetical protein